MIDRILSLVNAKDVSKCQVFKDLKCKKTHAQILQYMLKQYLQGEIDVIGLSLLSDVFGKDKYMYLNHLSDIVELIDDGYLNYDKLSSHEELLTLELLNCTVSLNYKFLNYLQTGVISKDVSVQIEPYVDYFEYLKDQFARIEYYQKLSQNKMIKYNFTSQNIKQNIKLLEDKISQRLKITTIKINIEELFKDNLLNEKEQIIFLALLKEEYTNELDSLRELNSLIALVSDDTYERMKNRVLLDEESKLVSNSLVEYDEMLTAFGSVSRTFYINDEILQSIMYPNRVKKQEKTKLQIALNTQDIFELVTPTTSLDDVVMHPKTRELMDNLLKQVDKNVVARLKKWGIKKNKKGIEAKILLYGPPGTGKTMTATSLAKSLKKQILSFDCSKILSKYVGESEQNVRRIFDTYKDICTKTKIEPILLLNEADQFLSTRVESGAGADKMHNQMQNIFLEQIEKFDGILVATTNFLQSLDMAFSRRFDYKIEFAKPDFAGRVNLWRRILPEEAVYEENFDIKKLANYPLSGAQIVMIMKNTALKVAVKQECIFTLEDFIQTIQRETNSAFGEKKFIGF